MSTPDNDSTSPSPGGDRADSLSASTSPEAPYRIAVIEDERANRVGIVAELSELTGIQVVGAYASFEEFNTARVGVDLVILDRWIRPDPTTGPPLRDSATSGERLTGHAAVAELRKRDVRVIVHTIDTNPIAALLEMAAGADAIVDKAHQTTEPLFTAIQASIRGRPLLSAPVARSLWQTTWLKERLTLNEREKAVLRWRAADLSNKQIAEREGITVHTVESVVTSVRDKLRDFLSAVRSGDGAPSEVPESLLQLLAGDDPMRRTLG